MQKRTGCFKLQGDGNWLHEDRPITRIDGRCSWTICRQVAADQEINFMLSTLMPIQGLKVILRTQSAVCKTAS